MQPDNLFSAEAARCGPNEFESSGDRTLETMTDARAAADALVDRLGL